MVTKTWRRHARVRVTGDKIGDAPFVEGPSYTMSIERSDRAIAKRYGSWLPHDALSAKNKILRAIVR
jgi:hypothetical protein